MALCPLLRRGLTRYRAHTQPLQYLSSARHYSNKKVTDTTSIPAVGKPQKEDDDCAAKVAACDRVTWLGAYCNVGLAGVKAAAGLLSGSPAMVADAGSSVSDVVSDGITLWALRAARAPKDINFPYGHGRQEAIGSLAVSALLLGTGVALGVNSGELLYECATAGAAAAVEASAELDGPLVAALLTAMGSTVLKEVLYRSTYAAGRAADSKVVMANAFNHRADAVSSIFAVIGIAGSLAGHAWLDPLAGLAVSGVIMKTGVVIGKDSLLELSDKGLEGEHIAEIRASALEVDGVCGVPHVQGRRMGPYLHVEMSVEAGPWLSISAAHHMRLQVIQHVQHCHEDVLEAFVQVVPRGASEEDRHQHEYLSLSRLDIERAICDVIRDKYGDLVESLSHVTVHMMARREGCIVIVDVRMTDAGLRAAKDVARRLQVDIESIDGIAEADIHCDLTEMATESSMNRGVQRPPMETPPRSIN